MGELEDGETQPLRLIEYDALSADEEVLSPEDVARMRAEMRQFLPETLADAGMPGYEFLGVRETSLGPLPALLFEYAWDGVRPGHFGGDHACIVWALGPTGMFHVYHHCSGEEWEARRPELDAILESFALMGPGEVAEEAAQGAAVSAFEAAKKAGASTEEAFKAGQAAYEAAQGVAVAADADAGATGRLRGRDPGRRRGRGRPGGGRRAGHRIARAPSDPARTLAGGGIGRSRRDSGWPVVKRVGRSVRWAPPTAAPAGTGSVSGRKIPWWSTSGW